MIPLAFAIVALILAIVCLVRSRAADLNAWACLALALAMLWGRVHI